MSPKQPGPSCLHPQSTFNPSTGTACILCCRHWRRITVYSKSHNQATSSNSSECTHATQSVISSARAAREVRALPSNFEGSKTGVLSTQSTTAAVLETCWVHPCVLLPGKVSHCGCEAEQLVHCFSTTRISVTTPVTQSWKGPC